jgi:hypothetical protein
MHTTALDRVRHVPSKILLRALYLRSNNKVIVMHILRALYPIVSDASLRRSRRRGRAPPTHEWG